LKDHGLLDIRAKVFKGVYMGRRYPDSYSDAERDLIKELSGKYPNNENYLNGNLIFKGESCNSGLASIKVNIDGSVQRCATVRMPLGNLFDDTFVRPTNPLPCTANRVLALSECKQLLVQGITLCSKL
jgi:hypothetical protein